MPLPRTEVSAATVGSEIMVLGGFTLDRGASNRVDAYSPAQNRWRRLPDLPVGVHHAMAVGAGGAALSTATTAYTYRVPATVVASLYVVSVMGVSKSGSSFSPGASARKIR